MITCSLFGHKPITTTYEEWQIGSINWRCERCNGEFRKYDDLETNKWKGLVELLRK